MRTATTTGSTPADVSVTNTDNDASGITVSTISGPTTEAGGTATFTVVLDAQPTADVTVGLSTSDATEGTVLPASLTFTSANWNTAQTVTVTGVNDDLDDGDIAYSIVTAAATSADGELQRDQRRPTSASRTPTTTRPGSRSRHQRPHDRSRRHRHVHRRPRCAADRRRDGRPLVERRHRRHRPAGVAHLHERELEHRADRDRDRRQRRPGRRRHRLQHRHGGARRARMAIYNGINPADVSVTNTDNDASGHHGLDRSAGPRPKPAAPRPSPSSSMPQPTADVTVGLASSDATEGTVLPASLTFTSANWNTAADRHGHGRQRRPRRRRHRLQHRHRRGHQRRRRTTTGSTRPTSASRTPTTTRPASRSRRSAAPRPKPAAPPRSRWS